MTNKLILVCGLPSSGNRFLVAAIKEAVAKTRGERGTCDRSVACWHGEGEHPGLRGFAGVDVVVPVRDPRCRRLSMAATGKDADRFPEVELRRNVARLCAHDVARSHFLSYEAMVADPYSAAVELFAFLGLERVRLAVVDGNAKYGRAP